MGSQNLPLTRTTQYSRIDKTWQNVSSYIFLGIPFRKDRKRPVKTEMEDRVEDFRFRDLSQYGSIVIRLKRKLFRG